MRFWDTSAVVPLVLEEPGTKVARQWLREDSVVVTWGLTRLELVSAVERRTAERLLTRGQRRDLLERFGELFSAWDEVTDLLAVRRRASSLLAKHRLRAADAAQLAAALLVTEEDPSAIPFVCLDRQLARAAESEGLRVHTWPE